MPTNISYQDSEDLEDCEVAVEVNATATVPNVGDMVVVFGHAEDEVGVPYVVRSRYFTIWGDDDNHQHVTVILGPKEDRDLLAAARAQHRIQQENYIRLVEAIYGGNPPHIEHDPFVDAANLRTLLAEARAALPGTVEVPCSDPQCGDSTWDHACDGTVKTNPLVQRITAALGAR